MIRARTAQLITETPKAHGVLDAPQETLRKVYCTQKSVGQTEAYQARATGLNPELKLILAHAFEYHGEKQLIYSGERYDIIRTYRTEADSIELTLQRTDGNAAPAEETEPETEPEETPGNGEGNGGDESNGSATGASALSPDGTEGTDPLFQGTGGTEEPEGGEP